MKRKIIQIVDRFISKEDEATLVALADDGTLWEGYQQCINEEAIKQATEYNRQKFDEFKKSPEGKAMSIIPWDKVPGTMTSPGRKYDFVWTQLKGLPDDNSNLGESTMKSEYLTGYLEELPIGTPLYAAPPATTNKNSS